jgi:hypothetical protein
LRCGIVAVWLAGIRSAVVSDAGSLSILLQCEFVEGCGEFEQERLLRPIWKQRRLCPTDLRFFCQKFSLHHASHRSSGPACWRMFRG